MDVVEFLDAESKRRLVLRRYGDSSDELDATLDRAELRALELASQAGIPAPEPLWIDTDGIFDEQAILISFLDGSPLLTPEDPIDWAQQLASALCRVHTLQTEASDAALLPPIRAGADRYMEGEIEVTAGHPLGQSLWDRLTVLRDDLVAQSEVFLHTDFWPGNTMWLGQQLVAVIDWEGCGTGDPAYDVAYCAMDMRYVGYDVAAEAFIATYLAESGRELANFKYWELVSLCRPMPDIGNWVPSWNAYGLNITEGQARTRHTDLIRSAVS